MSDFDIAMLSNGPPVIVEGVSRNARLHRLWEAPDLEKAIEDAAPVVRGLAATFHGVPVNADLLDRLPRLEIIASFGVGYDHIDAKAAAARGVVVTHTPGVLDEDVADIAMALVLNAVRRLPQAEAYLRAGGWLKAPYPLTASLRGRTLGILGYGRIGKAIARRAEAFGLNILYHGRHPQPGAGPRYCPSLLELAHQSDILLVAAPGGPETRHIVNAEIIDAVGQEGFIINIARGSLIDEAALTRALSEGRLMGAGLDVFADEPNVPEELMAQQSAVLLPHVGSASHHTRRAMAQLVVDNLKSWIDGKGPLTPVPETPWPRR